MQKTQNKRIRTHIFENPEDQEDCNIQVTEVNQHLNLEENSKISCLQHVKKNSVGLVVEENSQKYILEGSHNSFFDVARRYWKKHKNNI